MTAKGDKRRVRVFLSFPGTAEDLAKTASDCISQIFRESPWYERAYVEIGKWDEPDRRCTWIAGEDPNDAIARQQGSPQDADLFILCLTTRIGDGTIDEVRKRYYARGDVFILRCDRPPARTDYRSNPAAYDAARADYDEMCDWLDSPFQRGLSGRTTLGFTVASNDVGDEGTLRHAISAHLRRYLDERFFKAEVNLQDRRRVYSGLMQLGEAHAPFFFGRTREVRKICGEVMAPKPLIFIYGASGTGKSSLIGAGVIPELRKLDEHRRLEIIGPVFPARTPLDSIAAALYPVLGGGDTPAMFANTLRDNPGEFFAREVASLGKRIVLFIDQFEQVYTSDAKDSEAFGDLIETLVATNKVTVILVHRADRMGNWTERTFLRDVEYVQIEIDPLLRQHLADVIILPARSAIEKLKLPIHEPDPDLVDELLNECTPRRGQPNQLPLLAKTLQSLYKYTNFGERPMSLPDYEKLGRVSGIMRDSADQVDKALSRRNGGLEQLHRLFEKLVDVTDNGEPVAVNATQEELEAAAIDRELIELLQEAYFITGQDGSSLALAHEKYFEFWPKLSEWVDANRERLRALRDLAGDAERWDSRRRTPARLLRGEQLADAERLWAANSDRLASTKYRDLVAAFLEASRQQCDLDALRLVISQGDMTAVFQLMERGARLAQPQLDDRLLPFYDAMWGPAETQNEIRTPDPNGALNHQSMLSPVVNGFTPMHFAALAGRNDKIEKLHVLGCPVDVRSYGQSTPLMMAAYAGRLDTVKLLLGLGADPSAEAIVGNDPNNKWTALSWATQQKRFDVIELLTATRQAGGGPLSLQSLTTLILAAASGGNSRQLEKLLVQLQAQPEGDESKRRQILERALIYAAGELYEECAALLLAAGAHPSIDALFQVLRAGGEANKDALPVLSLLLTSSPDCILSRDDNGNTALHLAAQIGERPLMEKLLEYSPDASVRNKNNWSPLHFAAGNNKVACIELLLSVGADPNARDQQGDTPLHWAIGRGHEDAALQLLEKPGTHPSLANERGVTPLMFAARLGYYPIVAALLARSPETVNETDGEGNTALTHALGADRQSIVDVLLAENAQTPAYAIASSSTTTDLSSGSTIGRDIQMSLARLTGEGLLQEIAAHLVEADGDWPLSPVISDAAAWRDQRGERCIHYVKELAEYVAANKQWVNARPITRVRTLPLLCYSNGEIVECLTETYDGHPAIAVYLKSDSGMRLLNGTSRPLHSLNVSEPRIDLSEPENVTQYLRLFCEVVQAEQGPFHIVDRVENLPLSASVDKYYSDSLATHIKPVTAPTQSSEGDQWLLRATVLYSNALFFTHFRVFRSGIVDMTDDQPIAQELELGPILRFKGTLRVRDAVGSPSTTA